MYIYVKNMYIYVYYIILYDIPLHLHIDTYIYTHTCPTPCELSKLLAEECEFVVELTNLLSPSSQGRFYL